MSTTNVIVNKGIYQGGQVEIEINIVGATKGEIRIGETYRGEMESYYSNEVVGIRFARIVFKWLAVRRKVFGRVKYSNQYELESRWELLTSHPRLSRYYDFSYRRIDVDKENMRIVMIGTDSIHETCTIFTKFDPTNIKIGVDTYTLGKDNLE